MESNGVLQNVLMEDKLEELLVANWTRFIDSSKLLAFVLKTVQNNTNRLAIISSSQIKPKGVSITLSQCHWTHKGFILWTEFHAPLSTTKMAEGTIEFLLSKDGSITVLNILGNIHCAN